MVCLKFLGSLDAHQLVELLQSQGVKVRLLDLKRGDIRPGLADLRNRGIQNFLVDIGAEYLKLFFEEVRQIGSMYCTIHQQLCATIHEIKMLKLNYICMKSSRMQNFFGRS